MRTSLPVFKFHFSTGSSIVPGTRHFRFEIPAFQAEQTSCAVFDSFSVKLWKFQTGSNEYSIWRHCLSKRWGFSNRKWCVSGVMRYRASWSSRCIIHLNNFLSLICNVYVIRAVAGLSLCELVWRIAIGQDECFREMSCAFGDFSMRLFSASRIKRLIVYTSQMSKVTVVSVGRWLRNPPSHEGRRVEKFFGLADSKAFFTTRTSYSVASENADAPATLVRHRLLFYFLFHLLLQHFFYIFFLSTLTNPSSLLSSSRNSLYIRSLNNHVLLVFGYL